MMTDERDLPLDAFETAMLSELLNAQAELTVSPRRARSGNVVSIRSRRWRPIGLVGAVAAASLLVLGLVAVVGGNTSKASASPALPRPLGFVPGPRPSAVAFLSNAALLQSRRLEPTGSVVYAKTQNYALQVTVGHHLSTTVVTTTVREVWEASQGSQVREYGQDTEPGGGDVGGPKPLGGIDHSGHYQPGQWADDNLGLPATGPAARAWLLQQVGAPGAFSDNVTLGSAVAEHLSTGTATPQQTAALYQALASLPGVFDAGTVTDNAGRVGHAVGIVTSGPGSLVTGTQYFVIDPATGSFLESEDVATPGPPPALHLPPGPTVMQYNMLLSADRVAALGQAPQASSTTAVQ